MIAPASEAELPLLMEIERKTFLTDQFSEALYLSFIVQPDIEVYLHRKGDKAQGSLVLKFAEDDTLCQVISIAVPPEHQGHGYGKELMLFTEERARERNREQIQLEVRSSNMRAKELYESLQYMEHKILRDFYGPGIDAIRYIKHLT
jgi:ribosomal-protein-alanine N-acetyltransferase